jgi:serine/threonine protein kinase
MTQLTQEDELDLPAMLAQFPHLAGDKNAVLELALEEYEKCRERGEKPAARSFAARFPTCRTRLANFLLAREHAESAGILDSGAADVTEPALQPPWPEAGDRILGFTLLEELGRGGFARVYLARETALGDRLVALKVSLEGKDLPDAAAEAEILGRLPHENIVPIYSIQKDDLTGFTLVCMPYLGNTTLGDVLDFVYSPPAKPQRAWVILQAAQQSKSEQAQAPCKPSPTFQQASYIDGVLELGIQLADTLAFVHDRSIFHRDLKHSNVLVRPDGRPMLLDFNLSADQSGRGGKHMLGGTLLFMSPEHLRATARGPDRRPCLLDARSDLYALGVILYELLAGDHPFIPWRGREQELGEDEIRDLLKTRQPLGPRSIRRLNPLIDKHLAGVIEKCLAVKPETRFQSAAELGGGLRQCLEPEYQARRWLLCRRRRTLVATGVSVLFGLLLAAAAVLWLPRDARHLDRGILALQGGKYERAVDFLTQAVGHDNSFSAHMARARAYQKLGRFKEALEDFRLADKLQPSGHTKACIAYCFSRLETPRHDGAIAFYDQAIKRGYETAAIRNNMGFSYFMQGKFDFSAKECFCRAIELDPAYQLAYYNFFKVELETVRAVTSKTRLSSKGLQYLEKAFATGPASGQMHADAVDFFLLAKDLEPNWHSRVLHHVKQGIMLGIPTRPSDLVNDASFRQILRETPVGVASTNMSRIQDPFLSIDE